jgi:hypothetical protein
MSTSDQAASPPNNHQILPVPAREFFSLVYPGLVKNVERALDQFPPFVLKNELRVVCASSLPRFIPPLDLFHLPPVIVCLAHVCRMCMLLLSTGCALQVGTSENVKLFMLPPSTGFHPMFGWVRQTPGSAFVLRVRRRADALPETECVGKIQQRISFPGMLLLRVGRLTVVSVLRPCFTSSTNCSPPPIVQCALFQGSRIFNYCRMPSYAIVPF